MIIYRDIDVEIYAEDIEEFLDRDATQEELKRFLEIIHERYNPSVQETSHSTRTVLDVTIDEQLNKLRNLPLETIDKIVEEYGK